MATNDSLPGVKLDGLVLFGSPNCAPCRQASAWLDQQGISFRKVAVDNRERASWVQQRTGQNTVPQFFLNGHWLQGGFRQVQALVAQGDVPRVGVHQL